MGKNDQPGDWGHAAGWSRPAPRPPKFSTGGSGGGKPPRRGIFNCDIAIPVVGLMLLLSRPSPRRVAEIPGDNGGGSPFGCGLTALCLVALPVLLVCALGALLS